MPSCGIGVGWDAPAGDRASVAEQFLLGLVVVVVAQEVRHVAPVTVTVALEPGASR